MHAAVRLTRGWQNGSNIVSASLFLSFALLNSQDRIRRLHFCMPLKPLGVYSISRLAPGQRNCGAACLRWWWAVQERAILHLLPAQENATGGTIFCLGWGPPIHHPQPNNICPLCPIPPYSSFWCTYPQTAHTLSFYSSFSSNPQNLYIVRSFVAASYTLLSMHQILLCLPSPFVNLPYVYGMRGVYMW